MSASAFDVERHDYGSGGYLGQLVLQDVLTLHGSQFRDAAVIVASPPCQTFSYMAMPWSRAKALAGWYRGQVTTRITERDGNIVDEMVPVEEPSEIHRFAQERQSQLTALFDACFRIQREAIEATKRTCEYCTDGTNGETDWTGRVYDVTCSICSGRGFTTRYIPLIVENVKGAQPWIGRAAWHFGSFYLWGDVPALMPLTSAVKIGGSVGNDWFTHHNTEEFFKRAGIKNAHNWWSDGAGSLSATTSSHSAARKAASAQIAKIPMPLSRWIAQCFKPDQQSAPSSQANSSPEPAYQRLAL